MSDLISRDKAINYLRNALYKYEDEQEKKYIKDKNPAEWFLVVRPTAQNMNDIDVQTLVNLPSENPWHTGDPTEEGDYLCVFQSIWDVEYYWCYWDGAWNIYFDDYDPDTYTIVAWQKITYKEKEK